jgi:hypothetical protein
MGRYIADTTLVLVGALRAVLSAGLVLRLALWLVVESVLVLVIVAVIWAGTLLE